MEEEFLPCFPLDVVVLPGERLRLHIFETRYKQLIADCRENALTFGIPFLSGRKIQSVGCELKLIKIPRVYENGDFDMEAESVSVFKILGYEDPYHKRMYGAAQIKRNLSFGQNVSDELNYLFDAFNKGLEKPFDLPSKGLSDLQIAQRVLVSSASKYKLLTAWSAAGIGKILSNEIKMQIAIRQQNKAQQGEVFLN